MTTRDLLILAYSAFGGKMRGNTLLQKRVYFLGVMLGKEVELGYDAHYYGPYSQDVARANSELVSLRFVKETPSEFGLVDRAGFEVVRHDHRLTRAGERIAASKKERHADEWRSIEEAAERIGKGGNLSYMELSVAAKAFCLLRKKGNKATLPELRHLATRFGWSIGEKEMHRAAEFLEKIGLVEVSGPGK